MKPAQTIKTASMLALGGVASIIMALIMAGLLWFAWDMGWFHFAMQAAVVTVIVGIIAAAIIHYSERR